MLRGWGRQKAELRAVAAVMLEAGGTGLEGGLEILIGGCEAFFERDGGLPAGGFDF